MLVQATASILGNIKFGVSLMVDVLLGATDDGMGVVTIIQLVDYFSKHTPKRSIVFNINNGEEDWLNGAHVYVARLFCLPAPTGSSHFSSSFLEHPLSRNIGTFLNLEGAGSGG